MLISASDIIKKSIDLYKNNFKLFFIYSLLMMVPSFIVTIGSITLPLLLAVVSSFEVGLFAFSVLAIIGAVFGIWAGMAFIKTIIQRYTNAQTESIKSNLGNTVHLIVPSIWISILTGLAVFGGLILLIIPGIIFAIWFSFGLYTLVLDNKRGTEALKYSKSLISGRWFGVLWRLITPAFVFLIVMGIAQWIISIPFSSDLETESIQVGTFIYIILSSIMSVLVTPLTTTAPTILYEELKKTSITPVPEVPQAPEAV